MEQDCGSWCPPLRLNPIPHQLSTMFAPTLFEHQNTISACKKSYTNMVSASGFSSRLNAQPVYTPGIFENELHGCFSFPRSQQQFVPAHETGLNKLDHGSSIVNHVEPYGQKTTSANSQKRFFVFDHSDDRTTLIFSSGTGKPFPFSASWNSNLPTTYDANQDILRTKVDLNLDQQIIPGDDFNLHNHLDIESEMHEDTEELNALLDSDGESDYSEDEEVTSAEHLPDTVSAHEKPEASVGSTERIRSVFGHGKKRKIDDGCNEETTSHKSKTYFEDENDAESCCSNDAYCFGSLEFVPDNKRIKREKIFETVSLLRGILPDGERENPIVVLDKAIDYLKSLKLKAKSLGLDDL